MALRSSALRPSKAASIRICVDSRQNMETKGFVCMLNTGTVFPFESTMELLLRVDAQFSADHFPQAHFEYRSFLDTSETVAKRTSDSQKETLMDNIGLELTNKDTGEKATFVVEVKFRRNATWQGRVEWIDGKQSRNFRSSLELMKLIDEALDLSYGEDEEYTGWEE